ncbi:MAG: DinB family protein [Planctomycetaceae bacterium]|jgi:hypothetical protein|nr:DinB family protein [Planctomycetaceae bacterium]
MQNVVDNIRNTIKNQFDIAWSLLEIHLNELGDEECLWKPSTRGLGVEKKYEQWHPDLPESEGYKIGPPNIAWLTWHIIFWWSMVLDYSFGNGTLKQEDIFWSGSMIDTKNTIIQLYKNWNDKLTTLSDEDFVSIERTKWPLENKPFYELAAWLNLELMKNAAEIGYCRFLYATRKNI